MESKTETCGTCRHFRQHYVKAGYRFSCVPCGHCVYPRLKAREPERKACAHYKARIETQKNS